MNFIHVSNTADGKTAGHFIHAASVPDFIHVSFTSITGTRKPAGQGIHAVNHVNHGAVIHVSSHPFRGGGTDDGCTGQRPGGPRPDRKSIWAEYVGAIGIPCPCCQAPPTVFCGRRDGRVRRSPHDERRPDQLLGQMDQELAPPRKETTR